MKKILAIMMVLVLALGLFAGCTAKSETAEETQNEENQEKENIVTDFEDEVVFTVNEQDVMLSTVNFYVRYYKTMYENAYGISDWDMEMGENLTMNDLVKDQIQGAIIQVIMMEDIVEEKGLELTEDMIENAKKEAGSMYDLYDAETMAAYGLTLENIETELLRLMIGPLVFDELSKDVVIDEEALQAAVEADPTYISINEIGVENYSDQVRARHILISTIDASTNQPLGEEEAAAAKEKAEELLQRARDGEDFATLATENTDDPGSKETGGEYTFGYGKMVPEFETAAFGLEEGEISDLVETAYGYHIIKLEEKIPSTPEGIEEVNAMLESIREQYIMQQKDVAFSAKMEEMSQDYEPEINEEVWAKVTLK